VHSHSVLLSFFITVYSLLILLVHMDSYWSYCIYVILRYVEIIIFKLSLSTRIRNMCWTILSSLCFGPPSDSNAWLPPTVPYDRSVLGEQQFYLEDRCLLETKQRFSMQAATLHPKMINMHVVLLMSSIVRPWWTYPIAPGALKRILKI
jgi:hypothetical protein